MDKVELFNEVLWKVCEMTELSVDKVCKSNLEECVDARYVVIAVLSERLSDKQISEVSGWSVQLVNKARNCFYKRCKYRYGLKEMYKKMIKEAQAKGLGSEKVMWQSVGEIEDMLCVMKKEHPEMYWKFVRKQHGLLYNNHYTEDFAMWDVEHLKYTNKKGEKKEGAYWTIEQVEEATKGMSFPNGVNKFDKFVAYNAAHADFCKKFDDAQILDIAYLFYFADEDWKNPSTKTWDYMCLAHTM